MLIIPRAIDYQMICRLVKVGSKIRARTLTRSKLLQKLRKYIAQDVVGDDRIVAQPQGVLVNSGRKLIEDSGQCFFIKFLSSF